MKHCFGYVRVSTQKQGEQGVSLQEQREAILRFAARNGIEIVRWFEERETAAKRGRPVFAEMMRLLRAARVRGVVIHKIDRSARNLKDWADLGDLIDAGVEVHFAHETLDLRSRGGRLAADVQAVVAADYIRNLREETRKGFYGRLKQGFYPLPAPLGYLDRGKARFKELDPVRAPLVREAFELYASGLYTLKTLGALLYQRGLRTRRGTPVRRTVLSVLLNNPFYFGVIRLRTTGERFQGHHEPLIPVSLFERVGNVLRGKVNPRVDKHRFLYRQLLRCRHCRHSLVGEAQKGHVYYRCHTTGCPTTGLREETIDESVRTILSRLVFSTEERHFFRKWLDDQTSHATESQAEQVEALRLQRKNLDARRQRLTDLLIDGTIDKPLFDGRYAGILVEGARIEEQLAFANRSPADIRARVEHFLELAGRASLLYEHAEPNEQRELLRVITSNRDVAGKNVELTLAEPFRIVANRSHVFNCAPFRDRVRTWPRIVKNLLKWFATNPTSLAWEESTLLKKSRTPGDDEKAVQCAA